MQENDPLTVGVDHVGLAVKDLALARSFFCDCLGWKVVGENQSYPASFVSDGNGIVRSGRSRIRRNAFRSTAVVTSVCIILH